MNNFGLNGFNNPNNDNPLAQFLKQYVQPQQQENVQPAQTAAEPQRMNSGGGMVTFEINAQSDIEYIEPDKSGRRQIYICDPENKVYTGRYNHVRGAVDYRAYIDEGEVSLFQKNDTGAEMSQIAEALVAVVGELKTMRSEIQELKNDEPKNIEPKSMEPQKGKSERRDNGQFKKKGEA